MNFITLCQNASEYIISRQKIFLKTRKRKHRRVAAKPAACAKPLMLSTLQRNKDGGTKGGTVEGGREEGRGDREGREEGREVGKGSRGKKRQRRESAGREGGG